VSLNISLSRSRSSKLVSFESLGKVSYSHSIATMALSGIISEIKRDIGRKSRFFSYRLACKGVLVRVLPYHLVWLPDGEKSLKICLAVSRESRRVTDEQTDRHLATAYSHYA